MGIVPAGVHHADFVSVERRPHGRLERQVDLFAHRQRVHVSAQCHDVTRPATTQNADHTRVRDGSLHFDSQLTQPVGNDLRRPGLAIAELGMLMDVATAGDDFRLDLLHRVIDAAVKCGCGVERGGHQNLQSDNCEQAHSAL